MTIEEKMAERAAKINARLPPGRKKIDLYLCSCCNELNHRIQGSAVKICSFCAACKMLGIPRG